MSFEGIQNVTIEDEVISVEADERTKYITLQHDPQELDLLLERSKFIDIDDDCLQTCSVCDTCLDEPYIKCEECTALICLSCFSNGLETMFHKNNHSYSIVRDDMQLFFSKDMVCWTLKDEKLLLRAIQLHGYGNWEDIAGEFKGKFTKEQCCAHYQECYFGELFEKNLSSGKSFNNSTPAFNPYIMKMRTIDPPRHDSITSVQYEMMAGYRCARGEFDTPYDNSAESILTSIMDFEKPEEVETLGDEWNCVEEMLKCALVNAYNNRLRERYRRYKIMRDHGLIMVNKTVQWFSQYIEALGNKTNSSRFLVFMQICKPEAFDQLMESLKYFKETEKSIFRLFELRENGIRTVRGGLHYEKSNKERNEHQKENCKSDEKIWQDWRKFIKSSTELKHGNFSPFGANPCPRKRPGPLEITGLPGYSNLNKEERELCKNARLIPQNYLDYKKILIAENAKNGHVKLNDARRLIKIDVNKTRQIFDFLIETGHIKRSACSG